MDRGSDDALGSIPDRISRSVPVGTSRLEDFVLPDASRQGCEASRSVLESVPVGTSSSASRLAKSLPISASDAARAVIRLAGEYIELVPHSSGRSCWWCDYCIADRCYHSGFYQTRLEAKEESIVMLESIRSDSVKFTSLEVTEFFRELQGATYNRASDQPEVILELIDDLIEVITTKEPKKN